VPTSAVVVLLLVLSFLYYRRRQRVRRASPGPFDFLQATETREESVSRSELPSIPTLPLIQGRVGWNDPPAAAFASAEPARDPFADPVSMFDKPTNASHPSVAPSPTRAIRRVPMADPFADPPVVIFTPQGEAPSRLSQASSYDVRDARASVTSSHVSFSFHSLFEVGLTCSL